MRDVPPAVTEKAILVGATSWLEELEDLVEEIAKDWRLTVGEPFVDPTEAFVAKARLSDGTPVVLKLIVPQGETALCEITALSLDGGRGCARLLRHDVERGAILLERLGQPLVNLGVPVRTRHEILCEAARRVWRPVSRPTPLPTGAEKAAWLARSIITMWQEAARPLSQRAIESALSCAESRRTAHSDESCVLVHGDVHQWNALQAGELFKLVDPDGLVAEAEYDLGVIMREDPLELLEEGPRERSARLAEMSGLDESAIFEWGVVERVSTGLLLRRIGLEPVASEMLAAAEVVAKEEFG